MHIGFYAGRRVALLNPSRRNNVATNLDGNGGSGFFASLGGPNTTAPDGAPSAVLGYLRERLRAANTKGPLQATKLTAPSGYHALAITRLSTRVHEEVLNPESHLVCLESLKGELGLLTSAVDSWHCQYNTWATRVFSQLMHCNIVSEGWMFYP